MIGKIPAKRLDGKSSFKDLVNYCLGRTGHSKEALLHVGERNLYVAENAAMEMEDLAEFNTRCKCPAFHYILSWRAEESPTNEQVDEAVYIALEELNLLECQAVWGLQNDTDNLHVHVVVNRVSPETYKAVRPAGGWTKKALERAARKIEIKQGWEIEKSGRYEVNNLGQVEEKNASRNRQPEVSQEARDFEVHTGQESIERLAKRGVAPILETAESWEEIHHKLAEKGFKLARKGNGGVLIYNVQGLKLSRVSRGKSFVKLEQKLGKFIESNCESEVQILYRKPREGSREVPEQWEKYKSERLKYSSEKREAIRELQAKQKTEYVALCKRQRESYGELRTESWVGRGRELNFLRSLFAHVHRKERLELRDRQRAELRELQGKYLSRYPSYGEWLSKNGEIERNSLSCVRETGNFSSEVRDLRGYHVLRGAQGRALYCRLGSRTADFTDTGRRIILNDKRLDEGAVLSALQLANQKWGATEISGSDEYKELCVSLAVKHGLKISNPDLSAGIERCRKFERGITAEEIVSLKTCG